MNMDRFDKKLLEIITQGNSVILIGSGASVGAGYPTWSGLVELIYNGIKKSLTELEQQRYFELWEKKDSSKYLSFFYFAEKRCGKNTIVDLLKNSFAKINPKFSDVYSIITSWPINVYLTTNYDSEIKKYLDKQGEIFIEKGNTEDELRSLNSSTKKTIYKIHGNFENPARLILTEKDYINVQESNEYAIWREKIFSILHMCNVILIGYSAEDPDFKQQLDRAKKISNPASPVYMFTANMSSEKIDELFLKENIRVIPYDNSDGKHSQLTKLLKQYDAFIPHRGTRLVGKTESDFYESEIASSIFLYTEIVFQSSDTQIIINAFANCILSVLQKRKLPLVEIQKILREKKIAFDKNQIEESLKNLIKNNFVYENGNWFSLTEKGQEFLTSNKRQFDEYRMRFNEYCKIYLKNQSIPQPEIDKIIVNLHRGLEILFKKRGLEIARRVISDSDDEINFAFDIAAAFEETFANFSSTEYNHFIELLINILQTPSEEIRNYLALLCNSYFIYNILGHDVKARTRRLDTIRGKKIFLDSSVLISLIANSCQTNRFTIDLLEKLKKYNTDLWISEKLFKELFDHAYWAIKKFAEATTETIDLYQVYQGRGGYKQNLFVDGVYNWSVKTGKIFMDSFFVECLGENYKTDLENCLISKLSSFNISILKQENMVDIQDAAMREEISKKIKEDRLNNISYRNDFQCETEAELLVLSKKEPFCFITQTNNLKKLDKFNMISNWSPEGLYRFLQMNDCSIDLDNLYNCMVSDIYNSGFHVINKEIMDKISSHFYAQADLNLKEVERISSKEINKYLSRDLIDSSKRDGTYPFYAMQVQSKLSDDLIAQKRILEQQTLQLEKATSENKLSLAERNLLSRLQNKEKQKKQRQKTKRKKNRKHKK